MILFRLLGENGKMKDFGLYWVGGNQVCCTLALFPKLCSRPKPDNAA